MNLEKLGTERRNTETESLDQMSVMEILKVMNSEDAHVLKAVKYNLPQIEKAIELCYASLHKGGRMIYIGAGTSGRIGVMDAVECIPTFSSEQVLACMAGGSAAFVKAKENVEDDLTQAEKDLNDLAITAKDTVIGLAASGRTPYVLGGLKYAASLGCSRISISCSLNSEIATYADVSIELDCGPEIITGSTRLKAGTAQKIVCNMLSTVTMIKLGKTYGNLMVDMKPTNEKLRNRAIRIVTQATGCSEEKASEVLRTTEGSSKLAIVCILCNTDVKHAKELLKKGDGFVRNAILLKDSIV